MFSFIIALDALPVQPDGKHNLTAQCVRFALYLLCRNKRNLALVYFTRSAGSLCQPQLLYLTFR